ncbi:hypothetical protein NXW52_05090 [Bacteroides ovatus]|nr:hypothetical protein NXW52_05090 [Bacteroides ovatus]
MGQYSIISSRRNSLIEQIQSLNLQIKKENNQSEKKMLTIRRDTLQKKLDYINQAIEKQNIRSTPHFVGEETSQEENKAPGSAVSTGKSQPSTNDLDRFKRTVTNYINQGNSITAYNYIKTRSHTDGFQRNNAKCLDEKGISRFVPHSSI